MTLDARRIYRGADGALGTTATLYGISATVWTVFGFFICHRWLFLPTRWAWRRPSDYQSRSICSIAGATGFERALIASRSDGITLDLGTIHVGPVVKDATRPNAFLAIAKRTIGYPSPFKSVRMSGYDTHSYIVSRTRFSTSSFCMRRSRRPRHSMTRGSEARFREAPLMERLRNLTLRRRNAYVRREFPPIVVHDIKLDLHLPQRSRYYSLCVNRRRVIGPRLPQDTGVSLLVLATGLKIGPNFHARTRSSSKLHSLYRIAHKAAMGERIPVFSRFHPLLSAISQRTKLPYNLLTGSMSSARRQLQVARFHKAVATRTFLVPFRAREVEINLGEALHVITPIDRGTPPSR